MAKALVVDVLVLLTIYLLAYTSLYLLTMGLEDIGEFYLRYLLWVWFVGGGEEAAFIQGGACLATLVVFSTFLVWKHLL